jgi:hypothetical protein
MPEHPRSFYSRLFPHELSKYPPEVMAGLAARLEDTSEHRGDRTRAVLGAIPSGYVYFAQLVDHDLSHDKTPFANAGAVPPEKTRNWRTPRLDLEILYGEGRELDAVLYDRGHPQGPGYLALGPAMSGAAVEVPDNDLKRNPNGVAQVFDWRNDTTLVLAQLQVLLIKFHNRLLDDVKAGKVQGVSGGDDFAQTKRLATWHYQWLIWNDLLPRLVLSQVLDNVSRKGARLLATSSRFHIPVEFTLAAFQYGHSAVQFIYNLNRTVPTCPQEHTMYLTGFGHFQRPDLSDPRQNQLPAQFIIDPMRMFGLAPRARCNFSAPIDTLISPGLYRVPGTLSLILNNQRLEDTGLTLRRNDPKTYSAVEAALQRAGAVGLPSGQVACREAGVPRLKPEQLAYSAELHQFLDDNGLLRDTPLFYYLLREAELLGKARPNEPSRTRLGPLGSRIVAEVLLGVLQADRHSYLHRKWQPPVIYGDKRGSDVRIDSLKKLALYAAGYQRSLV